MVLFPSAYPERPSGTIGTSSLGVLLSISVGFGSFLMQINAIFTRFTRKRIPDGNPPPRNMGANPPEKRAGTDGQQQILASRLSACGGLSRGLSEKPLALQIDHLPRFAERKGHRIVVRGERVGPDETVLLANTADFALDHARSLKLTIALVGRGADDEAFVLDGLRRLFRFASVTPAEQRAEK
jgi:hypothetical protein